jgi:hypothetical protein
MPDFLKEEPGKTVFVGDVLRITDDNGETTGYEVQNGGWNWEGLDAPDTWLSEHVLARFEGKRVRITIEELGDSEEIWREQRRQYFGIEREAYIEYLKRLTGDV